MEVEVEEKVVSASVVATVVEEVVKDLAGA